MSERPDPRRAEIIESYNRERDALLDVIKRVDASVWAKPSPCPGWSTKDLVAHMATSATALATYVQWMLEGRPNQGKAALDARNETGVQERRARSLGELVNELKTSHQRNIDLLLSLSDSELAVQGALISGELITVEDRFRRAAKHYREHGRMLARVAGLGDDY
ncbi:MAG TPA: maleylpyruvate isomerase family mycothiol-dependent enzyme [Methylomirabilota bacterium]|nr:maleylpyruvate isomerase family mycothiol-dependent enzyme [Methylomirabilota bacterium]